MATVYFIQSNNGPVKIGRVSDTPLLFKRIRALQLGNGLPITVLGVIPNCSLALETVLHQRFSELRQHGEWFDPTPELLSYIKENTTPLDQIQLPDDTQTDDDILAKAIAGRLARARKVSELTQEQVTIHLGISRAQLANMETGRSSVSVGHLIKLAKLYNRSVEYLIKGNDLSGIDEDELLGLYRELTPEAQQVALDVVKSLLSQFRLSQGT